MQRMSVIALIAMVGAAACSTPVSAQDEATIAAGRELARKLCARCHAVGQNDTSALAKAPPFRVIARRYSVWSLQESLAEGIVTGHAAMPQFVFNPDQIDQLLTYMDTLSIKKRRSR